MNTSVINNNKIRFDDWNTRLQSFPAYQDYLLHISELSPGESCPVKVLDLYKCYGTDQKYCPGYIRRLPDNPWLSPMRIFYSQPTKWELIDFMGTSIHIFDTMEGMQQSWGDVFKSPIDDDSGVWEDKSNENSPQRDTDDGINLETHDDLVVEYEKSNENLPSRSTNDVINMETHNDFGVEDNQFNQNSPSSAANNVINSVTSETPTITFTGTDQCSSTEIANNPSPPKKGKAMSVSATAAGNQKKTQVFDEAAFLGPRFYLPRMRKTQDPYLHCDGYLYRKSSQTRYLCNRWMHPLLDNEWLTQNQSSDIVNYLNKKNNEGKKFINVTCPAVLEINRETHYATITTSHTCDMPHCKTPVATRANPPNDAVEGNLDPVNDLDNK